MNESAEDEGPRGTQLNKDGWAREGKLFYEKVKLAIRGIPVCDWKCVWEEYWNVEWMNHISERKKEEDEACRSGRSGF